MDLFIIANVGFNLHLTDNKKLTSYTKFRNRLTDKTL